MCWAAGLGGVWRSIVSARAHAVPPAASPALRGLPRRVGALPQRRAPPTPLLRPRRAAGLQAVAARPGQLPRVGGEPQPAGPGERRVWAQSLRGHALPSCFPPEKYPKLLYRRDFRPRQIQREAERKEAQTGLEAGGEDNRPALGSSAGPWGQDGG